MFDSLFKRKKIIYTDYELKALEEIRQWESRGPGFFIKALDFAAKPITMVMNAVPKAVVESVGKAIMGFMEMLKDISYWTYSAKGILKEARRAGLEARSISELAGQDLRKLDAVARSYFSSNKVIAAIQGAGCGLGGLALMAADIPALFTIGFRSIQQIGSSYGFDMEDPEMLTVVLGVFNIGSGASVAVKAATMADMHAAALGLARDLSLKTVAERTYTGAAIEALRKGARGIPEQIAENITRRKLAQAIPLVGAAISAGFNYWFISNTVITAYMTFRKLSIEMKYAPAVKKR